jgi:putative ABC transport system permease protein
VAGAALLVYTLFTSTFPRERGAYDPLYTLGRGLLLALGLVALAVASPRPYDALARGTRGQGSVLVAARYLMAKRRAAGLTMAMIAIVVMVVTVMGTLFSLVAARQPDDLGGYQIEGTSPLPFNALDPPIPAGLSHDVADAQLLPRLSRAGLNVTTPEGAVGGFGAVWGVTPGFAQNVTLSFSQRDARYATDREAWTAIARGEAIAAADFDRPDPQRFFNATLGEPVTLHAPLGVTRTYAFAGYVRTRELGLLISANDSDALGLRTSRVVLVRAAPGADPDDVAARLTAVYQEQGLDFQSFRAIHQAEVQAAQPLVLVVEAFLGVGLLVGLSSTGILASRAVHERRREIGTLRALGFEETQVRLAFLVESTLTTLLGTLVGVAVGLVVAASVWYRMDTRAGLSFSPPWLTLGLFVGALLVLSALAALGPAIRASRLPPAVAVRHVE